MKNSYVIGSLARTMAKTSESIDMIVNNIQGAEVQGVSVPELYKNMLLDDLAHVQLITLEMTELLLDAGDTEEHTDESAFAEGELNSKIPNETEEEE